MGVTFIIGVIALYLMRDQFTQIKNLNDAIYFAFMTYSTVGYGSAAPITPWAQYLVIIMALIGVGSFCTLIGAILGPYLENKMKRIIIMLDNLTKLENHAIICGINAASIQIAKRLAANNIVVLFISENDADIKSAKRLGYYTYSGDPTDPAVLEKVYLKKANLLIGALTSDADNILLSMTARQNVMAQDKTSQLKIISLIERQENIENAKLNGADIVIIPAALVADDLFQRLQADEEAIAKWPVG